MTPDDALLALTSLRSTLSDVVEVAGLNLQHVDRTLAAGHPVAGVSPDWPRRIGTNIAEIARTAELAAREYRRVLLVLGGQLLDRPHVAKELGHSPSGWLFTCLDHRPAGLPYVDLYSDTVLRDPRDVLVEHPKQCEHPSCSYSPDVAVAVGATP